MSQCSGHSNADFEAGSFLSRTSQRRSSSVVGGQTIGPRTILQSLHVPRWRHAVQTFQAIPTGLQLEPVRCLSVRRVSVRHRPRRSSRRCRFAQLVRSNLGSCSDDHYDDNVHCYGHYDVLLHQYGHFGHFGLLSTWNHLRLVRCFRINCFDPRIATQCHLFEPSTQTAILILSELKICSTKMVRALFI